MTGYFLLIFLAVLAIGAFAWALAELYRCFIEASHLRGGVARLRRNASPKESFPGATHLQKRAAAVAQKANEPRLLVRLDPERELETMATEFSARLGRARALSGLLIICGLLVTLANLRTAVEEMKIALEPSKSVGLSAPNAATQPGSQVRQGIGGIATAAGTAFGYSFSAISLAAIVLLLSIGAQRSASSAVRIFATWLFERHDELLLKHTEQPQDIAGKLEYAADALARVATTFEDTNAALADLKLFGGKLETAAQEISGAVAGLPTQLDSSMTKISGDVAQGIRTGLQHQGEYLKALVAIYSEHAPVLQKTIEFISRLTQSSESASSALVHLQSLPDDIRAVAASVANVEAGAHKLTTTIQTLDIKVEALPAGELAEAATNLSEAAVRLIKMESEVAALQETAKAFVQSAIDEVSRRSSEAIVQSTEKLSEIIQGMRTDVTTGAVRNSGELQRGVDELKALINKLRTSDGSPNLKDLRSQLQQLTDNVRSLPSMRLMSLFGGGRGTTGRT